MLLMGYTLAERDDLYVTLIDVAMQTLSKASAFGTYLVNYTVEIKSNHQSHVMEGT